MTKLTSLTGIATKANEDLSYVVDKSDTGDDPAGSSFNITHANEVAQSDLWLFPPTVAALATLGSAHADGDIVTVKGYANDGDGGGGQFRLDTSGTLGASADDGGVVVTTTGGTDYYWRRIIGGQMIIPQWWGAVGDADVLVQDSGTDNGAALESWFDFATDGFPDWATVSADAFTHIVPADLFLPAGVYRTNRNLEFNLPTGGQCTLHGAGERASIIMAGNSAVTTLFSVIPSGGSGAYGWTNLRDIGFNGGDYAATGISLTGSSFSAQFEVARVRVIAVTGTCIKISAFGVTLKQCALNGYNLASDTSTALLLDTESTTAINGLIIQGCYFNRGIRGLDINRSPQKLVIENNVFDQIDQAGIALKTGSRGCTIQGNYFEEVGRVAGTDIQIENDNVFTAANATNELIDTAHGLENGDVVFLTEVGTLPTGLAENTRYWVVAKTADRWQVSLTEGGSAVTFSDDGSGSNTYDAYRIFFGPIVASRPHNSGSTDIRGLQIRGNRFSNVSPRTIISLNTAHDMDWENNELNDVYPVRHIAEFIDQGVYFLRASRCRIQQSDVEGQSSTSIVSADAGADTLTISPARNLCVGFPMKASGGSLPTGMTTDTIYYSITEGLAQTTIQIADTLANAEAGTQVDITLSGSGTFTFLSLTARKLDFSRVFIHTQQSTGVILDSAPEETSFRGYSGSKSLGGNPAGWTVAAGSMTVTEDPAPFEGSSRVWEFTSSVANPSTRQFDITLDDVSDSFTLRNKWYRVSGLIRVASGAGLTFGYYLDTGSGYAASATANMDQFQTEAGSSYDELRHWMIEIPWDAVGIRFELLTTDATVAYLTRFSITDAAIDPSLVPIATDEDPLYVDEVLTVDSSTLSISGKSDLDSTSNKVDCTLPDGNFYGQLKLVTMSEASNSSTLTITSHKTSDPETFTFDDTADGGINALASSRVD